MGVALAIGIALALAGEMALAGAVAVGDALAFAIALARALALLLWALALSISLSLLLPSRPTVATAPNLDAAVAGIAPQPAVQGHDIWLHALAAQLAQHKQRLLPLSRSAACGYTDGVKRCRDLQSRHPCTSKQIKYQTPLSCPCV